jgi:hypothetical protein
LFWVFGIQSCPEAKSGGKFGEIMTMMGLGSCRDEEEEEADERTALEAAEKQASADEDVFFVTSLGKCAIGSRSQLVCRRRS